jgi:hypothetical protein
MGQKQFKFIDKLLSNGNSYSGASFEKKELKKEKKKVSEIFTIQKETIREFMLRYEKPQAYLFYTAEEIESEMLKIRRSIEKINQDQ